jgi:hypothetical protein
LPGRQVPGPAVRQAGVLLQLRGGQVPEHIRPGVVRRVPGWDIADRHRGGELHAVRGGQVPALHPGDNVRVVQLPGRVLPDLADGVLHGHDGEVCLRRVPDRVRLRERYELRAVRCGPVRGNIHRGGEVCELRGRQVPDRPEDAELHQLRDGQVPERDGIFDVRELRGGLSPAWLLRHCRGHDRLHALQPTVNPGAYQTGAGMIGCVDCGYSKSQSLASVTFCDICTAGKIGQYTGQGSQCEG